MLYRLATHPQSIIANWSNRNHNQLNRYDRRTRVAQNISSNSTGPQIKPIENATLSYVTAVYKRAHLHCARSIKWILVGFYIHRTTFLHTHKIYPYTRQLPIFMDNASTLLILPHITYEQHYYYHHCCTCEHEETKVHSHPRLLRTRKRHTVFFRLYIARAASQHQSNTQLHPNLTHMYISVVI